MHKIFSVIIVLFLSSCANYGDKNSPAPKVISMEKPVYPVYAYKNGISGVVRFRYDVDAQGKVSQMRITQSEPDHLFDDVVIRAVAKWRFEHNKPAKDLPMTVYMRSGTP